MHICYVRFSGHNMSGNNGLGFLIEERILPLIADLFVIDDLFRASDKEHAARSQRPVELTEYLFLCLLRKVD